MMDWWLQKGIDGFRMDVINLISKVPGLPDAPAVTSDRYQFGGQYFVNGPRLMEFFTEMKQKVLSRYDILTVGETPLVTTQDAIDMANEETGALKMVFQFEHMDLSAETGAERGRGSGAGAERPSGRPRAGSRSRPRRPTRC